MILLGYKLELGEVLLLDNILLMETNYHKNQTLRKFFKACMNQTLTKEIRSPSLESVIYPETQTIVYSSIGIKIERL